MKENSKRVDPYKKDYSSKFKTRANIFERRTKNNKTFVGRKRNLWDENINLWDKNSNLRKDKKNYLTKMMTCFMKIIS